MFQTVSGCCTFPPFRRPRPGPRKTGCMIRPLGDIAPNRKERMGNMDKSLSGTPCPHGAGGFRTGAKAGVSARMDRRPLSSGRGPQGGCASMIRACAAAARAGVRWSKNQSKSLSENPLGHDMAGSALSAAGGVSFHVGRRCLFGGKTALGIPARTAALPGAKTQAIMAPMGFRIGSKSNQIRLNPTKSNHIFFPIPGRAEIAGPLILGS
jgi:hypothetical protein